MNKIPWNELENAEREIGGLHELNSDISDSPLANPDIVPVPIKMRRWGWWDIACLWIGMAVCIPTYMLAAGLMSSGMNFKQAILTILFGNAVVLIPMILNAHAGTKYGIPFPVLIRTSFGISGAHIPSTLRGLVACGWFGIQTWIGGVAIYEMIRVFWPGIGELLGGRPLPLLGINLGQTLSFLFFWALHMAIVIAGVESIRKVEAWGAPILILIGLALGWWAWSVGGGFANVLAQSDHFQEPSLQAVRLDDQSIELKLDLLKNSDGSYRASELKVAAGNSVKDATGFVDAGETIEPNELLTLNAGADEKFAAVKLIDKNGKDFVITTEVKPVGGGVKVNWWLTVFFPLLTAMVGYWATLSLNIPDFSRFAKSQKEQFIGQAVGLPTTMTFYAFIGVFVTCASLLAFPDVLISEQAPWDPVQLLARFKNPLIVFVSMFGLALATITTNVAANVVAPAVGFSNLAPNKITFKMGGIITGFIGILIMPWKLLASAGAYIFTWLIGYSALLGGIAGVMISDYYIFRRAKIDLLQLYIPNGKYKGFNFAGITAFVLGVIPNIPGFLIQVEFISPESLPSIFRTIYTYAWFVSFGIAFVAYPILAETIFKKSEK